MPNLNELPTQREQDELEGTREERAEKDKVKEEICKGIQTLAEAAGFKNPEKEEGIMMELGLKLDAEPDVNKVIGKGTKELKPASAFPKSKIWRVIETRETEDSLDQTSTMVLHGGGVILRSVLVLDGQLSQAIVFMPQHEVTADGVIREM